MIFALFLRSKMSEINGRYNPFYEYTVVYHFIILDFGTMLPQYGNEK